MATPARGRVAGRGRGRGRVRAIHVASGRDTVCGGASPPIPQNIPVQPDIAGLSVPSLSSISATQSLSASPSKTLLTGNDSSQKHVDSRSPRPSSVVAVLDNLAPSTAFPPGDAKRKRKSEPSTSTPAKAKRQKVIGSFRTLTDSGDETTRTSTPGFNPTVCQTVMAFHEVVESDGEDDDFVPLGSQLIAPRESLNKKSALVSDDVVEISD